MPLSEYVSVERRYQRSINIEHDFGDINALKGYVFPESAKQTIFSMVEQIQKTGQGAFTWTGPYGSGKSSLAIALSALLSGSSTNREKSAKVLGLDWAKRLWKLVDPGDNGIKFLPVVGANCPIYELIGRALKSAKLMKPSVEVSAETVLAEVKSLSNKNTVSKVFLFIDEMGKTLEHAVKTNSDVYFYQELAEIANRSNGNFVVIGVLHQAFQEYASLLSRQSRDEWAKIQGRFIDLAVDIRADEQLTLIASALSSNVHPSSKHAELCHKVAGLIERSRIGFKTSMSGVLVETWPMHPIIACMLGPLSRKASGQNYRSVFSFLNSAEPQGFQDFIANNDKKSLFGIEEFWSYLMLNLKGALLASSDGHKWAVAIDAVDRAQGLDLGVLAVSSLKAISVIDWLKDGSSINTSFHAIHLLHNKVNKTDLRNSLKVLQDQSLITYRRYNDSYALFEGSDFNIEQALNETRADLPAGEFTDAQEIIELPTVIAKRHYHATGTLRWGNFILTSASNLISAVQEYEASPGGIALCAIVVGGSVAQGELKKLYAAAYQEAISFELLIADISISDELSAIINDVKSLTSILENRSELAGDRVARREIRERIMHMSDIAKTRLIDVLDELNFRDKKHREYKYAWHEIGRIIDEVAFQTYHASPKINNELLNREKPSPMANLALKRLLYGLLYERGQEHLSFKGFPAERGLLDALLVAPKLYQQNLEGEWALVVPDESSPKLSFLWSSTEAFLSENGQKVVSLMDIYKFWMSEPFGLTKGVCPLFAAVFIMTKWNDFAFYRQGLFRSKLSEIDVDVLLKSPELIDLRWMSVTDETKELLFALTDLALRYHDAETLQHSETIDVAKALIAAFDKLPAFTSRTQHLSKNARNVRTLFKSAHDPNKFIFEDIPALQIFTAGDSDESSARRIASNLGEGLDELFNAYPMVLKTLQDVVLRELQVPNTSPHSLDELKDRAKNIKELSDDHVLEAFITRLISFNIDDTSIESIASLAASKPSSQWIDSDVRRAELKLIELARSFRQLETVAHIKGRENKSRAMAMVVDMNAAGKTVELQFNILQANKSITEEVSNEIIALLVDKIGSDKDLGLSILTRTSERLAKHKIIETAKKAVSK